MKFSALFLATIAAGASATELRSVSQQQQEAERLLSKYDSKDSFSSICGECENDVFYHYQELGSGNYFFRGIFTPPGNCKLAAIRDEESRRAAQYAIPDGKIALTQGYFPIADYISDCHFENEKEIDGEVTGCGLYPPGTYISYFVNYEGTQVVQDGKCWVDIDRSFVDGALYVGIGADGLLRPVRQWDENSAKVDDEGSSEPPGGRYAYDGYVFECCPRDEAVCNELLPEEVA